MENEKLYILECDKLQLATIADALNDWHGFLCGRTEMENIIGFTEEDSKEREGLRRTLRSLRECVVKETVSPIHGNTYVYADNGEDCPNKWQRRRIETSYSVLNKIKEADDAGRGKSIYELTFNSKYNGKLKSPVRFSLILTEEEMGTVADAVEDWHRFLGGQTEMWNASSLMDDTDNDIRRILIEAHTYIVPLLAAVYGVGASYGWSGGMCPNPHQRIAMARSYGIYRQIRHFFAVERATGDSWNVYLSGTLTCREQGQLIKITKVKNENAEGQ